MPDSDFSLRSSTYPSGVKGLPGTWKRYTSDTRGRLVVSLIALALLIGLVWSLSRGGSGSAEHTTPPAPVLVARVAQQNVVIREQAIGTILANATVQLTPQVEGRLFSAEFKEGQIVHRGDILFRIDPRPFQAAYDSAVATLTAARAKAQRYQALLAQKAVSPQDADDARAAYLQAKAATDTARLNLSFTQIRSPIDGKTGPILVQPGNLVGASGGALSTTATATTGSSASPLVVITQIQPVKVTISLPQSDLPKIMAQAAQQKLQATIQVHGAPETVHKATVDFISNAVSDQTGTIELRATLPNTDNAFVPGQLVDVAVALANLHNVTTVPSNAVNLGPNGSFVYVIDKNSKAQMVAVKVLNDDGKIAAVQGKLKKGERIITDGQLKVAPGKPVRIAGGHRRKP